MLLYRTLLGCLLALTLTGMVGARLAGDPALTIFFDNLHWTCGFSAGALLASRLVRQADAAPARTAAIWMTCGMLSLAWGQLIWDLQVLISWTPLPGPSDIFYLGLGPMVTAGLWGLGKSRLDAATWRTVQWDTLACVTATLAASMALFLPRQGDHSLFQVCVMAAYPLMLMTPACLGLILALTLRARWGWHAFMLPATLAVFTLIWTEWNLRLLGKQLVDGDWLNLSFTACALLIGGAIKGHRLTPAEDDPAIDRRYEGILRMMPLALVVLTSIGLIYTMNAPGIPASTLWWAQIGSGAVVLMAFMRQRVLLRERDRLLDVEKMLRQREAELEMRVAERTRELALATRNAQSANQAKTEFLANMSHEIRTPLNGVLGFAQLAMLGAQTETQRGHLEKIQLAGKQLLRLINDILDMSRIEAGKLSVEHIPFELDTVLKSVDAQLGQQARDKGLALSIAVSPQASQRLLGDPLRIEQILLNYLSNAIKFTDKGSVTLRAEVIRESPDTCTLRVEVADTGSGMPAEMLPRLFSNFEQADNSMTRRFGGSGLGLAICKRLADLMGGTVGVASEPGGGSCFWFGVTLDKADVHAPRSVPHHPPTLGSPEALRGARILLAEDNEVNQMLAVSILEQVGATVRIARTGREALDMLRSEPFDCVLMDVQMPDMDGLEATRQIRADARLSHVHIIAMTANARPQDQERCKAAGMDDVVCKPYDARQMCATVAKWAHSMAA